MSFRDEDEDYDNYVHQEELEFESIEDQNNLFDAFSWEKRTSPLIPNFLGSEISKSFDNKYRKLANIHRKSSYAENEHSQIYGRFDSIRSQYSFLKVFMPEPIFHKICEMMGYSHVRRKFAKDIGINVERLTLILALWQLELYTKNDYIKEKALQEINDHLLEQSTNKFRRKGHITMKDIQRAEDHVLNDIFVLEGNPGKCYYFKQIPKDIMTDYKSMVDNILDYIPDDYAPLRQLKKLNREFRPTPQIFTRFVRKEIMKRLIYNISVQYKYTKIHDDPERVEYYIERLFIQREVTSLGDIPSLCIVLLNHLSLKDIELQKNMPQRFYTRVRAYIIKLLPVLEKIDNLPIEKINKHTESQVTGSKPEQLGVQKENLDLKEVDYNQTNKGPKIEIFASEDQKVGNVQKTIPKNKGASFKLNQEEITFLNSLFTKNPNSTPVSQPSQLPYPVNRAKSIINYSDLWYMFGHKKRTTLDPDPGGGIYS